MNIVQLPDVHPELQKRFTKALDQIESCVQLMRNFGLKDLAGTDQEGVLSLIEESAIIMGQLLQSATGEE